MKHRIVVSKAGCPDITHTSDSVPGCFQRNEQLEIIGVNHAKISGCIADIKHEINGTWATVHITVS